MRNPIRFSSQGGFTMLEVLMAISISLIILAMGAGLALQGIPVERKLTKAASNLEVAARKAAMKASLSHHDAFLTLESRSVTGLDGNFDFGDGKLAISRPGKFASFKTPPAGGYRWKFGANGLCEPLHIKLSYAEGEIELNFDPLTGETRNRSLTIFETR